MNGHYEYDENGIDDEAVPSDALDRLMAQLAQQMGISLPGVMGVDIKERNRLLRLAMRDISDGTLDDALSILPFDCSAMATIANTLYFRNCLYDDEINEYLQMVLDADLVWFAANPQGNAAEGLACKIHGLIGEGKLIPPAVRVDEFPVPLSLAGVLCLDNVDELANVPDDIGLPTEIRYALANRQADSLASDQIEDLYRWLIQTRLVWRLPVDDYGHSHVHYCGIGADQRVTLPANSDPSGYADFSLDLRAMLDRSSVDAV